jgi:hypothetical protein
MKKAIWFHLLTLATVLFALGCNIDFGNGGGDGNVQAELTGTITSVTPSRSLEGIRVQVTDADSGVIFSDTTDASGIFLIEGTFSGVALKLQFLDESSAQIALTSITVFPGAKVDVGNISLTNGVVTFSQDVIVTYKGDVTENNCSGNTGTLIVTKSDEDVIVEVRSSTIIRRKQETIDCSLLLIGETVEISGSLTPGNTVDAFTIDVR